MPEVNDKELGVGEEKGKIEETSENLRKAVAVAECDDQQVQSQAESCGGARDPAGGADCACKRYGIWYRRQQAQALFILYGSV